MPAPSDDLEPQDDTQDLQLEDQGEPDVIDQPDGGALVKVDDDQQALTEARDAGFFENLAETLDPGVLEAFTLDLVDKIQEDRDNRTDLDKKQAEGIKRTGFSDDAPGGASFEGASKVVHPMIGKATIQYSSKCMKELFPPDGPVKAKVVGKVTAPKLERADRKMNHMNWQFTEQMPEFRPNLEQLLTQVPVGGSQYIKAYWNPSIRRPDSELFFVDDVLLPTSAKSFLSARRRTLVLHLTSQQRAERVAAGIYVDLPERLSVQQPDQTESEKATAKVEGKGDDGMNLDGTAEYYESYVWSDFEDDMRPEGQVYAPYVATIEVETNKLLALYRNWDPVVADERGVVEEVQHVVDFNFLSWRGPYGLSLYQAISGLSISSTGALRALLDAAFLNNSQTALKLKNATGGQNIRIGQTGIEEVQGAVGQDDIRKAVMPLPYPPPSAVLFQLLGFLSEQAEGMVRMTMDVPDTDAVNTPVGTQLSRVEQGMQVFSSMHERNHNSMGRLLKIYHRINRDHLDADVIKEDTGELLAQPEDYQGPMDVVPVSDPNIFSELQRYGQIQVVAQRAALNPLLYNMPKVESLILSRVKIPDPESLLNTPQDPEPQDPVQENVAIALGKPAVAFPNQDHVAHLLVHLPFFLDQNFFMNLLVGGASVNAALQHLKEHLVLLYAKQVGDIAQRNLKRPLHELVEDTAPASQDALARMFAVAVRFIHGSDAENTYGQIMAGAQKLMQFAQQVAQMQRPQDPQVEVAKQAVAVQQAEVQRKEKKDQVDAVVRQQEAQLDAQGQQLENQKTQVELQGKTQEVRAENLRSAQELQDHAEDRELARQQAVIDQVNAEKDRQVDQAAIAQKAEADQLRERIKLVMNREDNASALRIALLELADSERARVSTGTGVNPDPGAR